MTAGWDETRVLATAPDASGAAAGQKLSRTDAAWSDTGADDRAVWGRCAGSGSSVYAVAVDRSGPAFRCSCPSRKFPCKHALGLLLRWSRGLVPAGRPDETVTAWLASRQQRQEKADERAATSAPDDGEPPPGDGEPPPGATDAQAVGGAASARAERRARRVADGLEELERWLHDQVRTGLAAARVDGPQESERMAARLVDAQAPGVAALVRDLPWRGGDAQWPARVLAALARLQLLARAARAAPDALGPVPAEVVRARVGWSTPTEQVLTRVPGVADVWAVLWHEDEQDGRLQARRTHVHGLTSGRGGLVRAWAPYGQQPDTGLVPGTLVDADLHPHPGSLTRLVVGVQRGEPRAMDVWPSGTTLAAAARDLAGSLTRDPWLSSLPVVLRGVRPARSRDGWVALDEDGARVPLLGGPPLDWLAVGGGGAGRVAGELGAAGLRVRAVADVPSAVTR